MSITRFGYDIVGMVVVAVLLGSLLAWFSIDLRPVRFAVIGLLLAVLLFTLNFFRDPDRVTPTGENFVIAPADGRVVLIRDLYEGEYLQGDAVQISIFMSPLNVHVNRYPISGTVGYFRYFPGEFMVAFDDKASTRNERTHIGIQNGRMKVLFKQIAGFVARRIIAPVKEGDRAVAGERFGMIRFGSRVDVILPRNVAVRVRLGEATTAGETVLAVVS